MIGTSPSIVVFHFGYGIMIFGSVCGSFGERVGLEGLDGSKNTQNLRNCSRHLVLVSSPAILMEYLHRFSGFTVRCQDGFVQEGNDYYPFQSERH
ncbi:hypothetical protein C8Q75DRAFT_760594 [Abortiporus biennis]|nr:hypothetical protein C8Q75DRAFT_760594 [Abortiporus biennis]